MKELTDMSLIDKNIEHNEQIFFTTNLQKQETHKKIKKKTKKIQTQTTDLLRETILMKLFDVGTNENVKQVI